MVLVYRRILSVHVWPSGAEGHWGRPREFDHAERSSLPQKPAANTDGAYLATVNPMQNEESTTTRS